jgi:hypothetical protein
VLSSEFRSACRSRFCITARQNKTWIQRIPVSVDWITRTFRRRAQQLKERRIPDKTQQEEKSLIKEYLK